MCKTGIKIKKIDSNTVRKDRTLAEMRHIRSYLYKIVSAKLVSV